MGMATDIKTLRERTGAGMLDCKKALTETSSLDQAVDWLRTKGIAKAAKKSGRTASEGLVVSYIHAGGSIGVLVELNCETDFVARNDAFVTFAEDVAMHIAAAAPEYLTREEVPESAIERERKVQLARVMESGKPEHIAAKIVEGRMGKFYEENCLLDQKYVKDDKKTVGEVVASQVATIGENIRIRRFARFVMGEGLERRSDDFAAEVAAAISGEA
jgi:elongation factor Ts